jgi:hypothetical protein
MEITLQKLHAIQEKVVVFENKNKKLQEQLMIIKDKVMTVINLVQKVKEIKRKHEKIENYMKQINSTLAVLESYAKHFGCKSNVYDDVYDNVNFEGVKDKEHLKDPIVAQLVYLNLAYIKYSNKCGPYTFPHKMNQQQIISEINQWKGYVPQQDKVYYDTVIKILRGQHVQSFSNQLGNDSNYSWWKEGLNNPVEELRKYITTHKASLGDYDFSGTTLTKDFYEKALNSLLSKLEDNEVNEKDAEMMLKLGFKNPGAFML